ncbi:MAG TPA: Rieske (2Fe-2S) protein [Bryobacteraceae bacterium]|jgi:nitrite reductase/ring-hydroxylating ferredoxin subunit|nr:Rieske (2Fe-2S) protein [Bryobacteraceae bacterium]
MPFQKLAAISEVPPGKTKFVHAASTPVILANWDGRIYALYGLCPHRGNPLEGAVLWDNLIDCPFHHFQYDVQTGRNHYPQNVYPKDYPELQQQLKPLKTYPVEVRDNDVWVDLE